MRQALSINHDLAGLEGSTIPLSGERPAANRNATSDDSPQWANVRNRTGSLRDRARILTTDAEELHHEAQDYDLNERASLKAREGHIRLLSELSEFHGMGWNDIAVAVGVSLSAVRKWRSGGTCTPQNRTALSRLCALMDLAVEACITEPASWLMTEVEHGHTLRYIDLIGMGRDDLVLDCAFHHKTPRQALDEAAPDWREATAKRYKIETDHDGIRSFETR